MHAEEIVNPDIVRNFEHPKLQQREHKTIVRSSSASERFLGWQADTSLVHIIHCHQQNIFHTSRPLSTASPVDRIVRSSRRPWHTLRFTDCRNQRKPTASRYIPKVIIPKSLMLACSDDIIWQNPRKTLISRMQLLRRWQKTISFTMDSK
jgi:hypothetical protein